MQPSDWAITIVIVGAIVGLFVAVAGMAKRGRGSSGSVPRGPRGSGGSGPSDQDDNVI